MDRRALARRISEASLLEGDFLLRSGRRATSYFDKYLFEAQPVVLRAVAEHAAALVPDGVEVLAGLELGGVPIAVALSLHLGVSAAFVRKAPKAYGTTRLAEGADVDGRRVLVVEDVITTGGQVAQSVGELRHRGALIDTVLCVIDRGSDDHTMLSTAGVAVRALFSAGDLSCGSGTAPPSELTP